MGQRFVFAVVIYEGKLDQVVAKFLYNECLLINLSFDKFLKLLHPVMIEVHADIVQLIVLLKNPEKVHQSHDNDQILDNFLGENQAEHAAQNVGVEEYPCFRNPITHRVVGK